MKARTVWRAVVVGSLVVVALSLLYFYMDAWTSGLYGVSPPAPAYSVPKSEAEAQQDDLDYLRNFTRLDWSYTERTRADANAVISRALRSRFPLSRAAFELFIARVLAIADNGHTNVKGGTTANRFNRLPLRFYVFADGVYVVRALPQAKALLGARLSAIDGVPIETLRARLAQFTGGTENEKNARLPFYLESPELLNAGGLAQSAGGAVLSFVDAQGKTIVTSLRALRPDPMAPKIWPSGEIKPQPNEGEPAQWVSAFAGRTESLPMFAGEPKPFFARPLAFDNAYYVRFDSNSDEGGMSIEDFASRTLAHLAAAQPTNVIIDLRMNGGGDYTNTSAFMKGLPDKLPDATFYVLMSQETFSAGMTSAAFLKHAGGDRVIFVGDKPGDRMRFHSEGGDFCLPYSHICLTARTAVHDYSLKPCRPFFECDLLDLFYPAGIRSFDPQIFAPLTYRALAGGHDPAIDAIQSRIEKQKS